MGLPADTVMRIVRANPGGNLGLVTGTINGLIVIDIDPRNGGEAWYAEHHNRLMEAGAIVAHTGGGGLHLFFAHPGGWVASKTGKDGIAPGVELKADGGQQVVISPSIHESGKAYTWNPDALDLPTVRAILAPLPPWIAVPSPTAPAPGRDRTLAEAFADDPADADRCRARLLSLPPAVEGQGGDAATFKAAALGREYGLSLDVFLPIFQEAFADRCLPPWTPEEAAHKARNAYAYGKAQAGASSPAYDFQPVTTPAPADMPARQAELLPPEPKGDMVQDEGIRVPTSRDGFVLPLPWVIGAHLVSGKDYSIVYSTVADLFALNQLSGETTLTRAAPWGTPAGVQFGDTEAQRLAEYLGRRHNLNPGKDQLFSAVEAAAQARAFHPVQEYLRATKWDGTPRLDTFLAKYFGAEDTPINGAMGRKWLISAVARAMRPGCKADYMLVLEGSQGRGKSTGFAALAGPGWFSDDFDASLIGDKDAVAKLRSKWIVEMPEAVAVRTSDVDDLKGYLSRTEDRCRLPFMRKAEDFPRQSVFCSTTNRTRYLHDATGGRRFWCVRGLQGREWVDRDGIARDRDQIWAEAMAAFSGGEAWYLTDAAMEAQAATAAEARFVVDSWESALRRWITTTGHPETFSILDAWAALHPTAGGDVVPMDRAKTERIRSALTRLGYEFGGDEMFSRRF
jgi:hypothetical protein